MYGICYGTAKIMITAANAKKLCDKYSTIASYVYHNSATWMQKLISKITHIEASKFTKMFPCYTDNQE